MSWCWKPKLTRRWSGKSGEEGGITWNVKNEIRDQKIVAQHSFALLQVFIQNTDTVIASHHTLNKSQTPWISRVPCDSAAPSSDPAPHWPLPTGPTASACSLWQTHSRFPTDLPPHLAQVPGDLEPAAPLCLLTWESPSSYSHCVSLCFEIIYFYVYFTRT